MAGNVPGAASAASTQNSFDLSNQADVLALLNYVRRSSLDLELQSEARNAILDYVTNPSNTQIEYLTTLLGSLPLTLTVSGSPTQTVTETTSVRLSPQSPLASWGRGRQKPQFAFVPFTPSNKATAALPREDLVSETVVAPSFIPHVVTNPIEAPTESVAVTLDPAPNAPTAQTRPLTKPSSAIPAPQPVTVPVNLTTRINEIKHAVNEKVGNPVNLIDADNTIGKEYMNALLAAMKVSTGGEAGVQTAAMERLEAAYAAVETMLQTTAVGSVTAPAVEPVGETRPVVELPPLPEPNDLPKATRSLPVISAEIDDNDVEPAPLPPPTPTKPPVVPDVPAPSLGLQSLAADLHALDAAATSTPNISERVGGKTSVTQSPQVVSPKAEPMSTDPLMDPKITAGLEQLLSEWSLFKSSGLFGTGPNGREHPLYKNLATIPMAAVISGRFEGVTPEIKQSITDYMNGWRYEQGMVHQIDETFEYYLRRVIKAILDKHPKAP